MAAATSSVSSLSTTHALHRLLCPPPSPPPFPSFFCRPISAACFTGKAHLSKLTQLQNTSTAATLFSFLSSSHSVLSSRSFSTYSLNSPLNALHTSLSLEDETELDNELEEVEDYDDDDDDIDGEIESDEEDIGNGGDNLELEIESVAVSDESPKEGLKKVALEVPKLTVKEKKELASYAHGLGKKLKSQLVGKSGFTDNVATSFIETLEANELLKIKIHRTCPGELEDVVLQLQKATGSAVVSQIGRTVIIYRPSISKMKAEEKKNQIRKVYVRKDSKFQPASPKGQVQRLTARGRRGSSRI
ncbi:uncharacterized protein [Euphorbia lathyris]|uniref:uncharacterized protein n=1 Tax=Euphorbia lathyris TaxID=212925 RepID=UPI0033137F5A